MVLYIDLSLYSAHLYLLLHEDEMVAQYSSPLTACLSYVKSFLDLSCLPNRSMEFSLYQETPHSQMQEVTPKEPNVDPGTLVWSSTT